MPASPHSPFAYIKKSYQKMPVPEANLERFIDRLGHLVQGLEHAKNEENAKTQVRDFLTGTFYDKKDYHVNIPEGRIDLAIHNGPKATDPIAVIIEAKKPDNQSEMPRPGRENVKGLHELLLYYLREREAGNLSVRHLVATNGRQWLVSDEDWWDKHAYQDRALMKAYREEKEQAKNTDRFYKEVAKPFFDRAGEVPYAWVDFAEVKTDKQKAAVYKLLSPEHLLKRPFANDSNSLNRDFYHELLYLLGLEEVKDKGKKLIRRPAPEGRQPGSLLENTIDQLRMNGKLGSLPNPEVYGDTDDDRLFSVGLELCITWLNRILFLKLLEGQLVRYYNGSSAYAFLTTDLLPEYDDLNTLFFGVLNRPVAERGGRHAATFAHVPYLNSMLFEPSPLEVDTLTINSLADREDIPLYSSTVLKDEAGRRRGGQARPLRYLLEFLSAYDFGAETTGLVQKQGKTLINAAVLGLIFEKINGYKDGSFFTPGYITMYMCRQALEPAALAKLNEAFGWTCETLAEARERLEYHKPADRKMANEAINSIRLCDPAVGSGHFLVSALNELLRIKGYLRVWQHPNGTRITGHRLEVENDELLVVREEDETLFAYRMNTQGRPLNPDDQRLQESLFHEKRHIIEHCLYGVDINPKSVAICRLRLWIELLKNAYYTPESEYRELETLPNLDINIGCGNSLVSRFGLEGLPNMQKAQRDMLKRIVQDLQTQADAYRASKGAEQKNKVRRQISQLKERMADLIPANDKTYRALVDARLAVGQQEMFAVEALGGLLQNKKVEALTKAEAAWEAKKAFFRTALEWRTEFPDLLDEEGNFRGFDVVIGNPPYIRQEELGDALKAYLKDGYQTYSGTADLYVFFVELGMRLLAPGGHFHYILPNKWMRAGYGRPLRLWVAQFQTETLVDFGDLPVFDEATTYPALWLMQKVEPMRPVRVAEVKTLAFESEKGLAGYLESVWSKATQEALNAESWNLGSGGLQQVLGKMREAGKPLGDYVDGKIYYGIKTGLNQAFVIDGITRDKLIAEDQGSEEVIKPFLAGRDIKRYRAPESDSYLLFTRRGIDIKQYPAIEKYLAQFKKQLEPKQKGASKDSPGRKPGTYKWYELQDSVDYYRELEKPKIVYPNILKKPEFTLDLNLNYVNQKCFFIGLNDLGLLGYLNSSLNFLMMRNELPSLLHGYYEPSSIYFVKFPVPDGVDTLQEHVSQILSLKAANPQADTSELEAEIDRLVYGLYGLTPDEIALVEGKS